MPNPVLIACWPRAKSPATVTASPKPAPLVSTLTRARSSLPDDLLVRGGHVNLAGCTGLAELPVLGQVAQLDLRNCSRLARLPAGLRVSSWLDLAGTAVTELPPALAGTLLRWRGVLVSEQVVFRPETLTAAQVLGEGNTEVRRVMLERVGFDRFMQQAGAEVLDTDRDPGGPRRASAS